MLCASPPENPDFPVNLFPPGNKRRPIQGNVIYFSGAEIPSKSHCFKGKIHRKVEKVEEVFTLKSLFPFLFRLLRLCGKKFFQIPVVSRSMKVHDVVLVYLCKYQEKNNKKI